MKAFFTLAGLVFAMASLAQDDPCPDAILARKGVMNMRTYPAYSDPAEQPYQKKIVALTHEMIKANYVPMGVNTRWGGAYSSSRKELPVDDFEYSTHAFTFFCKDGVPYDQYSDTYTIFRILFNGFTFGELYENLAVGDRDEGFHTLRHGIPVEISRGIWAFPDSAPSMGQAVNYRNRLYLVTYDGQLPWSYVTRKEFLLKRKKTLELRKKNELSAERDIPQDLRAKLENQFSQSFEKLEEQLSAPESELSKPAIVLKSWDNDYDYSFTDEDVPFAKILIKPNPSYFKKYPRRSVPQFITVSLDWVNAHRISTHYANDMIKALDLDFLKSLIGQATPPASPSFKGNAYAVPGKGIGSVNEDYSPQPMSNH